MSNTTNMPVKRVTAVVANHHQQRPINSTLKVSYADTMLKFKQNHSLYNYVSKSLLHTVETRIKEPSFFIGQPEEVLN